MSNCKCRYTGELETIGHRRFHARWASAEGNVELRTGVVATLQEVTDIYRVQDEIIACLHGGDLPKLTPGAQALLGQAKVRGQARS